MKFPVASFFFHWGKLGSSFYEWSYFLFCFTITSINLFVIDRSKNRRGKVTNYRSCKERIFYELQQIYRQPCCLVVWWLYLMKYDDCEIWCQSWYNGITKKIFRICPTKCRLYGIRQYHANLIFNTIVVTIKYEISGSLDQALNSVIISL